jgi:hypothetical protein
VNPKITGGRRLKQLVLELLQGDDFEKKMTAMSRFSARQAISPLFLFLCSLDAKIKWNAVISMGAVVSALAKEDLESARVVMRRLMWNLNDESGGIGWGCPEAMGEIMARSARLAEEYGCILISFIRPGGNFLEHKDLQKGVLWAVGRLAHARPKLLTACVDLLHPYLESDHADLRGLAAWACGPLVDRDTIVLLRRLIRDDSKLVLFREGRLAPFSVSELAQEALNPVKTSTMKAPISDFPD